MKVSNEAVSKGLVAVGAAVFVYGCADYAFGEADGTRLDIMAGMGVAFMAVGIALRTLKLIRQRRHMAGVGARSER